MLASGASGKGSPGGQSVRVVVRVRPPGDTDGSSAACSALAVAPDGLRVSLTAPLDNRASKTFQFDAALNAGASQAGSHANVQNF